MVIGEKLYTADEFFDIARLPENENRRLELQNGEIIEMPPSRPVNTIVAWNIARIVGNYVVANDLGYMSGADGGYKLAENKVRQPDAAFISKKRYT
jgi:Uma2 family endonuclease